MKLKTHNPTTEQDPETDTTFQLEIYSQEKGCKNITSNCNRFLSTPLPFVRSVPEIHSFFHCSLTLTTPVESGKKLVGTKTNTNKKKRWGENF